MNAPSPRVRALIYAHWDRDGVVDPYVLHALREYRAAVDRLVFVSTHCTHVPPELESLADEVIVRENTGFDFASWREGLGRLDQAAYDEILFTNSSVYGPLWPIADCLTNAAAAEADLWGMTVSLEPEVHLQSYFMGMSRRLLASGCGRRLWEGIQPVPTKRDAIRGYELRWMSECLADGFAVHAVFDGRRHPRVPLREQLANMTCWPPWQKRVRRYRRSVRQPALNPSHLHWKQVLECGSPLLKVDLLRDNPVGVDTGRIHDWLTTHTSYPVEIITAHLARMRQPAAEAFKIVKKPARLCRW
jgi:lipopolysaccharide biosynthesis protein